MSNGIIFNVPEVIRTYNVSRTISTTTNYYTESIVTGTISSDPINPDISPLQCIGFAVLILTTVVGNTLVLGALFLDKRLHTPSFFLIANMAIADLLLGLSVLPFSSVLELLNDRWIFGQSLCTAWLALDVLCCTASIIALMAVSIDRYIGVTRPLTYSLIMTTRRTIYLILIVWAVSILTSVVPLFGLTDRGEIWKNSKSSRERAETCKVNKNTFYTIFSSAISFYIPVIILLILYSRVYQEAKTQSKKLEQEKRRIYEIDYQLAAEQARQRQSHTNGYVTKTRTPSYQSNDNKHGASSKLSNQDAPPDENVSPDHTLTGNDGVNLKKDYEKFKSQKVFDDDISHSGSSITGHRKSKHRHGGKRFFSMLKRNSLLHTPQAPHYNREMPPNNELLLIKRKLHNLKREQKAFRTVGLILGALLICWLPFFVILPVMSIHEQHNASKISSAENTWFKIAFWLGYCNSALNPFVYAFSNRAIRRAFRQVIFRRCCCCFCRTSSDQFDDQFTRRRARAYSGSLTTDVSQSVFKGVQSTSFDVDRTASKIEKDLDSSSFRAVEAPVVSFKEFLAEKTDDDEDRSPQADKQPNQECETTLLKEQQTSPLIS
ncbi:unnamed protein product [Adineta ricciae]|uniref:G-protein coupled receptors family 1 profile domain-containing protein n=1 Tax=Adineta ricciae TaxID=249248 RepID=A0A813VZ31_ADIRI|nr:unnamed protein product [Adineta ricciae]CAF0844757.1 unnamed protein product [Adineta ricciae]